MVKIEKEKTVSQEKDVSVQEFMDEIVDDLGYTPRRKKAVFHKRLTEFAQDNKTIIFAVAGIVLLILTIAHFTAIGNKVSREDLAPMQGELQELKERIIALEGVERRLSLIEKQTEKSFQSTARRKTDSRKGNTSGRKRYYTVRKGDTLSGIGKKFGISAKKLCELNEISLKKKLQLGQKLLVKN